MTFQITDHFVGGINWSHAHMLEKAQKLTEEDFLRQPSSVAPPIGWHVWHIARWADMLQGSFDGYSEIWKDKDLVSEFGLDASKLGVLQMGVRMSHQDACQLVATIGQERLLEYSKTVFDLCQQAMAGLTDEVTFVRRTSIIQADFSVDPPIEIEGFENEIIGDLDFHKGHVLRHLGMIEGLIGVMFERPGTATM